MGAAHRLGDRRPWIARGEPGSIDDTMIHFNCAPVRVGDELYIYYSAGNSPHASWDVKWSSGEAKKVLEGKRHAFQHVGLATCRPDGFVSLDAPSAGGEFVTKPFTWDGNQLHLNIDASAGEAVVTLLDERGKALRGVAPSGPITGDHIDVTVEFERLEPALIGGRRIALRIRMRRAKLYSYWLST